jgi:hypothetical protein
MNRVTKFEKQEFIEFCKGKTIKEITDKYSHIAKSTIRGRIMRWNVSYNKQEKNPLNAMNASKIREFCKDKTVKEIVKHYKVTYNQAKNYIYANQIEYKKENRVNIDTERLFELRRKGYSLRHIADILGGSETTLCGICRQNGVHPEVKVERNRAKDDQFTYAKKICKRLNYKDAFDYINQNGIKKFQDEITPQITNALNNGTIKNAR